MVVTSKLLASARTIRADLGADQGAYAIATHTDDIATMFGAFRQRIVGRLDPPWAGDQAIAHHDLTIRIARTGDAQALTCGQGWVVTQ